MHGPDWPDKKIARQGLVAVECVRAHAHVGHHPAAAAAALKGAKPAQDANWRKVRKSCRKTFKASFEQKNRPMRKNRDLFIFANQNEKQKRLIFDEFFDFDQKNFKPVISLFCDHQNKMKADSEAKL